MMSFEKFVFMQHHRGEHEETIITSYTPRRITFGGMNIEKFLKRFNSEHIEQRLRPYVE